MKARRKFKISQYAVFSICEELFVHVFPYKYTVPKTFRLNSVANYKCNLLYIHELPRYSQCHVPGIRTAIFSFIASLHSALPSNSTPPITPPLAARHLFPGGWAEYSLGANCNLRRKSACFQRGKRISIARSVEEPRN